jgi:hypothetical protein
VSAAAGALRGSLFPRPLAAWVAGVLVPALRPGEDDVEAAGAAPGSAGGGARTGGVDAPAVAAEALLLSLAAHGGTLELVCEGVSSATTGAEGALLSLAAGGGVGGADGFEALAAATAAADGAWLAAGLIAPDALARGHFTEACVVPREPRARAASLPPPWTPLPRISSKRPPPPFRVVGL